MAQQQSSLSIYPGFPEGFLERGRVRMIRRFMFFTLIEEALVMGLMAWSYSAYTESSDLRAEVAVMVSFGVSLALSNAATFLQGIGRPWGSLRFSKRLLRVGVAIVTTFAIFLVAFTCFSLGFSLNFVTLLAFSLMAALGIGVWALIGTELSRESITEAFEICDCEHVGGLEYADLTLKSAMRLIEEDADVAWLKQPKRLRKMLVSVCLNDGKYSTGEVVSYLRGIVNEAGGGGPFEVADAARWVDFLFADVLVEDIVRRAEDWRENAVEITGLLCEVEQRIAEDALFADSARFALNSSRLRELGSLPLLQRIQAYVCIASSFAGNEDGFRSRLDQALGNVKANTDAVLSYEKPLCLAMFESTVGWGGYDPHARCWTAPLAMLAHAAETIGRTQDISESYRRYIRFLEEKADGSNALGGFLVDAQVTLSHLQGDGVWEECPDLPIYV